jgi:hypothetical protein
VQCLQGRYFEGLAGLLVCPAGLMLSPAVATLTLPLTVPLSWTCCWVLGKVGRPRPHD